MPKPPAEAVQRTATATDADDEAGLALTALSQIDANLTEILKPLIAELQATLTGLEGRSFGFDTNKAIIEAIQVQLHRLGMRVSCPRCGAAAIPRCRAATSTKEGSFQFEHYQGGKQTNHGGSTTFPHLRLIPAPPDLRRVRKKRKKA